jgi:PIN domain nuclease of toxin-antitoxin system
MKLLLDTHTFLWLESRPEKLSHTALAACEDPANQLYLSVVSAPSAAARASSRGR